MRKLTAAVATSRWNDLAPSVGSKFNLAADCLLLAAAAIIATVHDAGWAWRQPALAAGIAVIGWVIAARALHQYDVWHKQGVLGDLALTSVLILGVATELFLVRLLLPSPWAPSIAIPRFLVLVWPTLLLLRLFATAARALRHKEHDHVLIVGTGALGRVTGEDLLANRHEPKHIVGYLRFREDKTVPCIAGPVLGSVDDLEQTLKTHAVDEVYIVGNMVRSAATMQSVIRTCENFGVPFALPAHGFRFGRARAVNAKTARDGYIHYQSVEPKPWQVAMKRFFDIALSAAALWLLAPIFIATAIAIKLTSQGPIFFKQARVGMHARPFNMLKFRSMVVNAEALKAKLSAQNEQSGPVFKIRNDPRITSIGRFIRKFSIDELPQLINVLRGEMSLVGPRPPLPREVSEYEPWQRRRLSVRPGLTCVWQVSGRNEISFKQWMYLDMQYIDNWSLGQDFGLILKTVPVVVTGRGAS